MQCQEMELNGESSIYVFRVPDQGKKIAVHGRNGNEWAGMNVNQVCRTMSAQPT